MSRTWLYQVRIYLPDTLAEVARRDAAAAELGMLPGILRAHDARMVSQLDAFEAYVAEAEAKGIERFPLYRWTRATLDDPEKRRKHLKAFALRVGGQEVYAASIADALEADLRALPGGVVERLSRHDTNPANNLPVPADYR
jgi:hypothetical protein